MLNVLRKIRIVLYKAIDWLYFPAFRVIPPEVFRYGVTGGANTALDIFLYFIVYNFILKKEIVNVGFIAISPHIAAFLIVFPVTFCTGFLLAKYITFTQSELRGRIQLFRYGLTVAGSIVLNYVFLKFFVEYMHFFPTVSKAITTIIVIIYSYLFQRYFSFKTNRLIEPAIETE